MNILRLSRQALRGITTVCAGVSLSLSSLAQSAPADTGSVTTTGQITSTTCGILLYEFGSSTGDKVTKTIDLGSFLRSTVTATQGQTFGNAVGGSWGLSPPNAITGSCTTYTQNGWDLSIQLGPEQIVTIDNAATTALGTKTFLKNALSAADGGTDAVVILRGGNKADSRNATAADATIPLQLLPNAGDTANYISGGTSIRTITDGRILTAQFVNSSNAQPSVGRFSQTLTMLAVYR